jgi:hypothetical protein
MVQGYRVGYGVGGKWRQGGTGDAFLFFKLFTSVCQLGQAVGCSFPLPTKGEMGAEISVSAGQFFVCGNCPLYYPL